MRRILVIDCPYLGHRARFTTGPLSYKGQPTGVIYGFLNQVFALLKKTRPDEIVYTWDSRKSFRKRYCSTYKQGRKNQEPDPELIDAFTQFKQLRRNILPELGFVNIFRQTGCEADDLIAALVMNDPKREFIVATSDDDMLQLLDYCDIYNLSKDKQINANVFKEEVGIEPADWAKVKQIAGCTSDNVKGVPGIGEKTAIKYLKNEMNPNSKQFQSIKQAEELIAFNEYLVKLPLPETKAPVLSRSKFNALKMSILCDDLGFNRMRHLIDDWEALNA
jgi:DNA polymerase-1